MYVQLADVQLASAAAQEDLMNIAIAKPSGYGPLSAWPLMKCAGAVRIGDERPGNASAAAGISAFFPKPNIDVSLSALAKYKR